MKKLITIICLLVTIISLQAQNTNVRAQGNYYSAKKHFQSKNYEEAINYVNKSKTALNGTNRELQYLHILAAYNLYKYEEAAKELQTYFDMEEKKIKIVYFDKSVDRLTDDETKELSMLIDPILESAEHRKNSPCTKCFGSGLMNETIVSNCGNCKGNGYLKGEDCDNKIKDQSCLMGKIIKYSGSGWTGDYREWEVTCSACNGEGYKRKGCYTCHNTGKIESTTDKKITCDKCYGKGF